MAHAAAPKLKELLLQVPDLFTTNKLLIYPVEDQDGEIFKHLDRKCGIDYFVVSENDDRTIGLAWRAVKYDRSRFKGRVWNAFSIREKRNTSLSEENCELYKRKKAINLGLIYPQFTAQVHYDPSNNNELLSLAVARTEDVYNAFDEGLFRECNPNAVDKEVYFYDVLWDKMKQHGYAVYDWYKDNTCK